MEWTWIASHQGVVFDPWCFIEQPKLIQIQSEFVQLWHVQFVVTLQEFWTSLFNTLRICLRTALKFDVIFKFTQNGTHGTQNKAIFWNLFVFKVLFR